MRKQKPVRTRDVSQDFQETLNIYLRFVVIGVKWDQVCNVVFLYQPQPRILGQTWSEQMYGINQSLDSRV